jgi:hypothetical protein
MTGQVEFDTTEQAVTLTFLEAWDPWKWPLTSTACCSRALSSRLYALR